MKGPLAVRLGAVGVEIIDQDEVQIRGGSHFFAAELSHRHDGRFSPIEMAVCRRKIPADSTMHGADHRVGQPGICLPRLPCANRAGERPHTDEEHVFEAEHTNTF